MSFTDFSKFQEKRKAGFSYNTGIVIYWNKDELPQIVLFIPWVQKFDLTIKDNVLLALKDISHKPIVVFFSGMRWSQSNLQEELISSNYIVSFLGGDRIIPLDFKKKEDNVRITFGIIACDTSSLDVMPYFGEPKVYNSNIKIDNINYDFSCSDAPRTFGYAMLYMKYNAENYSSIDIDSLKPGKTN